MISILIPIYNGIEFIEESVSSILNQTYDKWELIIGINGHPQNSEIYKIAKKYENQALGKIRVFDFYTIRGKSNTLNEMIKYCNYNYIALLDVDDIWHAQKLESQSYHLDNYDIIGSNCIWIGDRAGVIPQIPGGDISDFNFFLVNPIINLSGRVIPYMEEPKNIENTINIEVMRNLFMNARHTILSRAIVDRVYTDVPIPRQINIGLGAIEYNPLQLPYFTSSENGDINVVNINTMEEVD